MAEPSRSSRRITVCLLIVLCLGTAGWAVFFGGGLPVVLNAVDGVREKVGMAGGLPGASPAAEKEQPGRIKEERSAHQVAGAIRTGDGPVDPDPGEALKARVEKALAESGPTAEDGPVAEGRLEDRPPVPDEKKQDSVVTGAFVHDMARWLVANYVPSHKEGRGGRTSATLTQVNARYSNSGKLRSLERDTLKSRAAILEYVFTPGMLEALYRMYAPRFLDEMEQAAREPRRRGVPGDDLVADMFRVYAEQFNRLASSLEAAASADLPALSAAIRRAAEGEAAANEDFSRAYTAQAIARDAGRSDEVAIQSRCMAESARVASMYAGRQEKARRALARELRLRGGKPLLPDAELIFLGEWLARHKAGADATRAAADVCRRMAVQCGERAKAVSAPATGHAGSMPQPEGAEVEKSAGTRPVAAPPAGSESPLLPEASGAVEAPEGVKEKPASPEAAEPEQAASPETPVQAASGEVAQEESHEHAARSGDGAAEATPRTEAASAL